MRPVPPPLQPCDSVYHRVGMRAGSQVHPAWAPSWAGPAWQSLCSWHGASLPRTVPGAWAGWRRKGEPPHCIPNNGRPGGVLLPSPVPSPWGGEGPDRETEVVPMSGQKAKQGRGSPRREELWQPQSPGVQPPETRATPLPCRTVQEGAPPPSRAGQEGPSAVWGCAGGCPSTVSGWAGGAHLPSPAAHERPSTVLCCASSEQAPPPWELGSQTGFSHFQRPTEKQECQINSSPGISHQRHRCRSLAGSQRAEESGEGACSLPAPVLRSRRWLGGREAVRKQQGQPMWPLRYMLCVFAYVGPGKTPPPSF